MAWAEQLPSGRWRGCYRDLYGKKRSAGTFDHKRRARNEAETKENEAQKGKFRNEHGARIKWGEWCDTWFPSRGVQESSQRTSRGKIELHVRPHWGHVRLGEINRMDVQKWVTGLTGKLSASSARSCYYLLAKSMKAAVAHGMIDQNPCTDVVLPTLPVGQERYLTTAEVEKLFFHIDGPHRLLAEILVGTGMRISEACGLHWDRVDLRKCHVDVVDVWDVRERAMKAWPKGKKRRTVPISDELVEMLARHMEAHPPGKRCGREHVGGQCRSSLVLTGPKGAPLDPHNFVNREWAWALDLADIGHARPHDLRHTYASWLLQSGVSLERVGKLLGHASHATTERYAHLMDDGHDEVRAALGRGAHRGAHRMTVVTDDDRSQSDRDAS